MNVAQQHEWFDGVAFEISRELKGTEYIILAMKDGYRVLITNGKIKRGFAVPYKTTSQDFIKRFEEAIDGIKKEISGTLRRSNSL